MLTSDLNVIVKVAEFRSITAAATSLDMSPATASAAVKRIEKSLGFEIFVRTTRQLRLSSAGERYLPKCQEALQILHLAELDVKGEKDFIEGELRISVSSDLGRNLILPWLDAFMDQHPSVSLKVRVSDSNIDFYRDPVDIALRYGRPTEANVYGFKICNVPRLLCANRHYIDAKGVPCHPSDLAQHNGLFYQLHDVIHDVWEFNHQGNSFKIKMQGNRASNDGDLVRRWCVAGKGIATKSSLDVGNDLLNTRLISVMNEFIPTPTEFWLICPSRQSITPAVRLLRDDLTHRCEQLLLNLVQAGHISSHAAFD